MAAGDGRYITLSDLKLYVLGAIADPNNPTVYNNAVATTPDDSTLGQCIQRAEWEIDRIAGIKFSQATNSLVQAFTPFMDGNGWLHLFARENAPVTAVTAVQYRDLLDTGTTWKAITLAADDIILPLNDGYAHPDSAHVRLYNSGLPAPRATGELAVKWTYTGGYAANSIPEWLKAITCRLSAWIYRLREAPMYKIVSAELGIMQIPLRIPPDIDSDLRLLQPVYS